jgi:CrcB protein
MAISAFLAIGFGAAFGAWLRWGLGLWLNPLFPTLPYGTLAANLIGGYLVGVAIAYFAQHPGLPPEWRLFAITGFLGSLTTFSTFSAEVFTLISRNQLGWALTSASAHLFGSLAMTALGVWTFKLIRG